MPKRYTLLAVAFAIVAGSVTTVGFGRGPTKDLDIVVLIGQSNMEGRGQANELPESFPRHASRLWHFSATDWRPARELVAAPARVGPAVALAEALAMVDSEREIGLVLCTKGGTSIVEWLPNAALYESCLRRISTATQSGRIIALGFYQGESDTDTLENVTAWPARFAEIVTALRREIGEGLPIVHVVIGKIERPNDARFKHWSDLKETQRRIALDRVYPIDAGRFDLSSDGLHLSTAGQVALGRTMADMIAHMRQSVSK